MRSPFRLFNRRNVTLDTNILVAYIISKKDNSVVKSVVTKTLQDDNLMITDIIKEECLSLGDRKSVPATREELERGLDALNVPIVRVGPIPPDSELAERYGIRDINDGKILYSVETTESVILVTYDEDFYDRSLRGLDVDIMDPVMYLYQEDIESKRYKPKRPKNSRLLKVRRGGVE